MSENVLYYIIPLLLVVLIVCFVIVAFRAYYLAFWKKKLRLYIEQINKHGEITKELHNRFVLLDLFMYAHLLDHIPSRSKHPHYYIDKRTDFLEKKIRLLSRKLIKVVIFTSVIMGLFAILLRL